MKLLNRNLSSTLRTLLFCLPLFLFASYNFLLHVQSPHEALARLESRLKPFKSSSNRNQDTSHRTELTETIVIGLVCCGTGHVRISELTVVLKSAILFSTRPLKFVIFADKLKAEIAHLLTRWRATGKFVDFDWDIREPSYPKGSEAMVSMFVPCATQRLFFPEMLTEYERILYLDTDFIFMNDPSNTWKFFKQMQKDQKLVGMSLENSDSKYSLFTYATHPSPSYGGLNSGLMLMDLEGLRNSHWTKSILTINEELAPFNVFGDQDLINSLFHYFPEMNYIVPCTSNIRLDYCIPPNVSDACPHFATFTQATANGDKGDDDVLPFMIHGSRGAFHENWKLWDKNFFTSYFPNLINWLLVKNIRLLEYAYRVQPVMENQKIFKMAFKFFLDFNLESDDEVQLLKRRLSASFDEMTPSDVCFDVRDVFIDAIAT